MPEWPASIQPIGIQEALMKNPECFNVSPEIITEENKVIFPLQFTFKICDSRLAFKNLHQHLIENEQQLPNI